MDIACGVLLGMCYRQISFNSFRGGAPGRKNLKELRHRRRMPKDIGHRIGEYIENEDVAYTKASEQAIGARPMPKCTGRDFIEACSVGLQKLKYVLDKCPPNANILQNPHVDETRFIPPGGITDPTEAGIMRIRQECILGAAKAGRLDVLQFLFQLPGFHFLQHWRVLLQTESKEIAALDTKMLMKIRN